MSWQASAAVQVKLVLALAVLLARTIDLWTFMCLAEVEEVTEQNLYQTGGRGKGEGGN